ncbi:hypothetical protein JN535_08755 [Cellulosimicrobium cellulans]|uniref:hypothetical protein n=1 Tax=Cellulosimicrobium cellulans TaxID=1710 RepID=UPI001963B7FE|nr:hypothetical protein [Cellulosimicrobium cellulans]MBN0040252.1 hypothetical protein [Cellulosimicrobium cellulans]
MPTYPTITSSPDTQYRTDALASLDPARCFLAVVEGDQVLEAGPIWSHDYDDDTRRLTLRSAGLWSLWDHRIVMKVLAAGEDPAGSSLSWSGLSLATIAKRLVQTAIAHVGGSLPLDLPADVPGEAERTYSGFELANLGQRLEELMGVMGGPDIAFRPYLAADRLGIRWRMVTGDPLLTQSGADWSWDTSAARGSTTGLSISRDATGLASRWWMAGDGVEVEMPIELVASSELTDAGFPLLEQAESRSSVSERATLRSWGEANLAQSSRPWMTWKFSARRDVYPLLGQYQPGDWARVYVPGGHPYLRGLLPEGHYRTRILEISGGLDDWVDITCAPTPEYR